MSAVSLDDGTVIRRVDTIVASEADGVLSMMHLTTGRVHDLSGVGRMVWEALDEPRTVGVLLERVTARYPTVASDVIRSDLGRFLDELLEAELITA